MPTNDSGASVSPRPIHPNNVAKIGDVAMISIDSRGPMCTNAVNSAWSPILRPITPDSPRYSTWFPTVSGNQLPNHSRCVTPSNATANQILNTLTAVAPIRLPPAVKNSDVAVHRIDVAIPAPGPIYAPRLPIPALARIAPPVTRRVGRRPTCYGNATNPR